MRVLLVLLLCSPVLAIEDPYNGQNVPPAEPETPAEKPAQKKIEKQPEDPVAEVLRAAREAYVNSRIENLADLTKQRDFASHERSLRKAATDAAKLVGKKEKEQVEFFQRLMAAKDVGAEHPFAELTLKWRALYINVEGSKPKMAFAQAIANHKVKLGMNTAEVTLAWGMPEDTSKTTTVNTQIETWTYSNELMKRLDYEEYLKSIKRLTFQDGLLVTVQE